LLTAALCININHVTYAVCDVVSVSDSDLITGVFTSVDISDKATISMSTLLDITMQSTSSSVPPGISHQATSSSTLFTDAHQVSIVRPGNKFSAACFQVDCYLSELTSETVYNQPTSPCASEHAISSSTLPGVNEQATRCYMLAVEDKHENNQEVEEYLQIVDNGPNLLQMSDNEPKHFQIADHELNYHQIVDHELNYLQIVDHEPKYLQIVENDIHCHKTAQVEPAYKEVVESGYQQITIVNDESHYHQIADNEPNYQQIESSDPGYEEITMNEQSNSSQATYNTPVYMPMDNHELHVTEHTHNNFINWIRNNKLVNN
jgi:hypothetical protein